MENDLKQLNKMLRAADPVVWDSWIKVDDAICPLDEPIYYYYNDQRYKADKTGVYRFHREFISRPTLFDILKAPRYRY